jgi:hypothetical protein
MGGTRASTRLAILGMPDEQGGGSHPSGPREAHHAVSRCLPAWGPTRGVSPPSERRPLDRMMSPPAVAPPELPISRSGFCADEPTGGGCAVRAIGTRFGPDGHGLVGVPLGRVTRTLAPHRIGPCSPVAPTGRRGSGEPRRHLVQGRHGPGERLLGAAGDEFWAVC